MWGIDVHIFLMKGIVVLQMKVVGLYEWCGNNSIIPELWLVPHFLPIHPGICYFVRVNIIESSTYVISLTTKCALTC